MSNNPGAPLPSNEDPDLRVVREIEAEFAKKEASREWRLWFVVFGVVLTISALLIGGCALLRALLMSGF